MSTCEHNFVKDVCTKCKAVLQYEICNVTESVICNSCMGQGGDFDLSGNSYNSFCGVCNGTGYETRQVTRKREYIVLPKDSDEYKTEGD